MIDLGKREGASIRFRSTQALLVDALLQSRLRKTDNAFADLRQRLIDAAPVPRQEPPTLTTSLRPYQRAGLGWLVFLRNAGLGAASGGGRREGTIRVWSTTDEGKHWKGPGEVKCPVAPG